MRNASVNDSPIRPGALVTQVDWPATNIITETLARLNVFPNARKIILVQSHYQKFDSVHLN